MAIYNKDSALRPRNVSDVAPYGGKSSFPEMYTAELIASKSGINLKTPLPENYQFNLATSWDNPFNQPLSSILGAGGGQAGQALGALATGVSAASGKTSQHKWASGAKWTGGSLFQLDIPFVIQAYKDTSKEVVKIMRDMLKLVAPSENSGGFLQAPGPNFVTTAGLQEGEGEIITIRIGNFFEMSPCIINSVNCEFDTQMDADKGLPISATITVSASSFFTTTQEDLMRMFQSGIK